MALVACAGPRRAPGLFGEPRATSNTPVVVNNNNWASVVVYAVNLGTVYRLGSVETGSTATFMLPTSALSDGDLELRAHPFGQLRDYSTGPILFAPGETIEFTVENLLELDRPENNSEDANFHTLPRNLPHRLHFQTKIEPQHLKQQRHETRSAWRLDSEKGAAQDCKSGRVLHDAHG